MGTMFFRTMILIAAGFGWWIFSSIFILRFFPNFGLFNQWMTNYHTNLSDVYQFWTIVPFIFLFVFGVFWSSGAIDMLLGRKILDKIF